MYLIICYFITVCAAFVNYYDGDFNRMMLTILVGIGFLLLELIRQLERIAKNNFLTKNKKNCIII